LAIVASSDVPNVIAWTGWRHIPLCARDLSAFVQVLLLVRSYGIIIIY